MNHEVFELDVDKIEDEYLSALNRCFGNWGGPNLYDWAFRRKGARLEPTLLGLRINGKLVAGSGITFRTVTSALQTELLCGIMTGSWTFPEAQGQGCFTSLIQSSVEAVDRRGGHILGAFVTNANSSFRRLRAQGSKMVQTHYLSSNHAIPSSTEVVLPKDVTQDLPIWLDSYNRSESDSFGKFAFRYENFKSWLAQIRDRPSDVVLLEIGPRGLSAVESSANFDRILFLDIPDQNEDQIRAVLQALLRRSRSSGRELFLFSTDPKEVKVAIGMGFREVPGSFTILPANQKQTLRTFGFAPTKPASLSPLTDPVSPLFLGQPHLRGGDRI